MKKTTYKGETVYAFGPTEDTIRREFEKDIAASDASALMSALVDALAKRESVQRQAWGNMLEYIREIDPSVTGTISYDHMRGHIVILKDDTLKDYAPKAPDVK